MKNRESLFTISAVEREVGLSKDVLRVWERRYGFPVPHRDGHGERVYPAEQVRKLRLVKRLMDQGMRPGKLLGEGVDRLEELAASKAAPGAKEGDSAEELPEDADDLLAWVRGHDAMALYQAMQQRLARAGLATFVQDIVPALAVRIGEEWARGGMEVHEEHLFTEVASRLIRQALAAVPPGRAPVVLLTTVPDEPHALGLLMVEAMLSLHGAACVNLGPQLPLQDIARAALAYRADVVALSFSLNFPLRQIPGVLQQLRGSVPPATQLWVGGAAVRRLAPQDGVRLLGPLEEAVKALEEWRPGR